MAESETKAELVRTDAAPAPTKQRRSFIVTLDVPDGHEEEAREYLADVTAGSVEHYNPQAVQADGPSHDHYGNPYNRDTTPQSAGNTHDRYGNPFDRGQRFGNTHDAYGNAYKVGEQPSRRGPTDKYGNPLNPAEQTRGTHDAYGNKY